MKLAGFVLSLLLHLFLPLFHGNFLSDVGPGHHGAEVITLRVVDRADQQVELLVAKIYDRLVREILMIGQYATLVCGVLVENIDVAAHDLVDRYGARWVRGLSVSTLAGFA